MAAFSYQELPFLVDCALSPEMMMKISSSSASSTTNSPLLSPACCFSEDQTRFLNSNSNFLEQLQFQYPIGNFHQEVNPIGFNLHESSCVEQGGTPVASSEDEPSANKHSTDQNGGGGNTTGAVGGGCGGGGVGGGEKGIGNWTPVKNKRKIRGDASSPNSSKDVRGGKSKKQKKCKNEGVKEEEEDEDRSNIKEQNKVISSPEAPKGYIHVRARRGQATDSHSLAERVRREKISERMKFLQALVPGCDKVTGKATMLDEIINYVQSLQSQVEFLSMKLSSLSPMVYSYGVDLDALLLEQQGLNNMAPPLPSVQQCNPSNTNPTTLTPPAAPATTAATTSFHCPLVGAPVVFQQQVQRVDNPPCLEDNVIGSLYWGVGNQGGSDPISQPGFNNNKMMYSL